MNKIMKMRKATDNRNSIMQRSLCGSPSFYKTFKEELKTRNLPAVVKTMNPQKRQSMFAGQKNLAAVFKEERLFKSQQRSRRATNPNNV